MEKTVKHLLVLAKKRLPEATGFQLECIQGGIREGEEILRLLADFNADRGMIRLKFVDLVIRLDEAGVIADEKGRPESA